MKSSVEIELHDYQTKTLYNLNLNTADNNLGTHYSLLVYDITNLQSFNHIK